MIQQNLDQSEREWEIDNLPNRLTIFRLCLAPLVVIALYLCGINESWIAPYHYFLGYFAGIVFGIASITDAIDGHLARKRNIVTVFGSFLDPIADKFLVVSSLITLLSVDRLHVFVVLILVLREFYITALRLLATEKGISVPVQSLGKIKTTFQMVGIPFLMANDNWGPISLVFLGNLCIYISCIFSVYSAVQYSWNTLIRFKDLRRERKKKSLTETLK